MAKNKFKPSICNCCGQTKEYVLGLDKGSAKIVLAMLHAIAAKGVNEIHPARELVLEGNQRWYLTNLSRPRFHGLIAYVDRKNKHGYYCLTRKAGKFLRGEPMPQYAIVSKVTGHQEGYWQPEERVITLRELISAPVTWSGNQELVLQHLYTPEEQPTTSLF